MTKQYHKWLLNWKNDMEKHYKDKRRVIRRKFCGDSE